MKPDAFGIALLAESRNDAIRGLMTQYMDALRQRGMSLLELSFPDELDHAVEQMSKGNVRFAITWLGVGQDFRIKLTDGTSKNVWEVFNVPLLKLHGDLPAYLSSHHGDVPSNSYNLYHAAEFLHFRNSWLSARSFSTLIPALPLSPIPIDHVDRRKRARGTLVFLKNGNSPSALRDAWSNLLSAQVSTLLHDLADELLPTALKPGRIDLGDCVAAFLSFRGIDPSTAKSTVATFSAQIDDYFRRVKSSLICEAMLDFPVEVRGDNWEHVDFNGRRAKLLPGLDYEGTTTIYREALGVVDMSPNVDTWPHDRIQRCAGSFTAFLTNEQSWLSRDFPRSTPMAFQFSRESIQEHIADMLRRPTDYLDLALDFGTEFRRRYTTQKFADSIATVAELAALDWSPHKPVIQSYFAWPNVAAI